MGDDQTLSPIELRVEIMFENHRMTEIVDLRGEVPTVETWPTLQAAAIADRDPVAMIVTLRDGSRYRITIADERE